VFQAPQSGQRPSHLGDCAPQSWQAKTLLGALLVATPYSRLLSSRRRPPA
jgi:hypothetical protein